MNGTQRLERRLDHIVRHARAEVPLYREMYYGFGPVRSVEDFARLPILTNTILGSEKLEKTFIDTFQLCITRTFEDGPRVDGYIPRLLSYEDVLDEYQVLRFLTKSVDKRVRQKVMLIADERHIYTIAELGKQLAYNEWPLATFIIRDQNIDRLRSYLAWFNPTVIFLDARLNLSTTIFPCSVKSLFTFNQPWGREIDLTSAKTLQMIDIFRDAWTGLMATRGREQNYYRFNPNYFYFEVSPDGALLVTSFFYRLQPVIRYKLPHRGTLVGRTGFALE